MKIGDKTLELPLVSSAVATLGLSRDSFFLRYTAEKVVEITTANISDVYVMNQPDGWNATIEDNELTITAPTKKAIEIGAAQAKGLVLVHATDEDGKCVVAKIEVTSGEGLTIKVDSEGNIELRNAYTSHQKNDMMQTEWFGFTPFHVVIMPAAYYYSFEQNNDGLSYEDAWNMYGDVPYGLSKTYSSFDMGEYVEGQYEIDVIKTTVQDLYFELDYSELPYGAYVLVVASDNGKGVPADGIQVAEYLYFNLDVEVTSKSHNDIKVKVTGEGPDMYIIGGVPQSTYLETMTGPKTFDQYMTDDGQTSRGPWVNFTQGFVQGLGQIVTYFDENEFEFSPYILDSYGSKMSFDTTYDIWVMPIFNHMLKYDEFGGLDLSAFDYTTHFKPHVIMDVKTNPVVVGEVTAPTITTSSSYTKVYADITPAEGTTVYYSFITSEKLIELDSDKAKLDYLIEDCYVPLTENGKVDSRAEANECVVLLTATLSADGKYATADKAIYALSYPTDTNDALTITLSDATVTVNKISIDITPAANTTYYYSYVDATQLSDELTDDAKKLEYLLTGSSAYTEATTAIAQSLSPGTSKTLLLAVVDAENKYKLFTKEAATSELTYNENIVVTPVSVSFSGVNATIKVKVTGGATKVAFKAASPASDYAKTSTEVFALSQDTYGNVVWGNVDTDGYATATINYVNKNYTFYAVGCVVDGENVSIGHAAGFLGADYLVE